MPNTISHALVNKAPRREFDTFEVSKIDSNAQKPKP